jgi:L-ascorbate metabolism protein UlaG (beta-lactamase superfamily)
MASSHVNPEDALQIMIDLEAEHAFGMHWGTFVLTDEDTLEPPQRLRQALKNSHNIDFQSLQPGKVIYLK